jgi:hypothetical protein
MVFIMLFMTVLPSTLIAYAIGLIFIKKLRLTKLTLFGGLIATWIFTAIIALMIAETPNVNSASKKALSAAFIASMIGVGGIASIGRRRG